jgi:hypothetical protein
MQRTMLLRTMKVSFPFTGTCWGSKLLDTELLASLDRHEDSEEGKTTETPFAIRVSACHRRLSGRKRTFRNTLPG